MTLTLEFSFRNSFLGKWVLVNDLKYNKLEQEKNKDSPFQGWFRFQSYNPVFLLHELQGNNKMSWSANIYQRVCFTHQ